MYITCVTSLPTASHPSSSSLSSAEIPHFPPKLHLISTSPPHSVTTTSLNARQAQAAVQVEAAQVATSSRHRLVPNGEPSGDWWSQRTKTKIHHHNPSPRSRTRRGPNVLPAHGAPLFRLSWCFVYFLRSLWQKQEPNLQSLFVLHNMFRPWSYAQGAPLFRLPSVNGLANYSPSPPSVPRCPSLEIEISICPCAWLTCIFRSMKKNVEDILVSNSWGNETKWQYLTCRFTL